MRPPMPSIALSRRAKIALSTIAGILVVLVIANSLVGVYVDWLWFGSLGYRGVFTAILETRVVLFVVFGLLMSLIIGGNMVVAYLLRPPFRPLSTEQQNLERYRVLVEPRKRVVLLLVTGIAGLIAGATAQSNYRTWQLWRYGGDFGIQDAQFHKDVAFFAWDYPVYRLLVNFFFVAVVFALIFAVVTHYLFGAIRLQTPGPKMTLSARRHITVLVFVFIVLKAIAYWLDRYGLVFSDRGKVTGASYTDVNASLPAKTILFWIALIIAVGVLATLWLRSPLLPAIGFVVLIVISIVINGIYPAAVQQFSVKPNASDKEAKYISRNITATREAYGIVSAKDGGTVDYQQYPVDNNPDQSLPSTSSDATVRDIRILDPNVISPTFANYQAVTNPYGFSAKLDVDRYTVDGASSDYIVGVRELNAAALSGNQTNWINQHTYFTHGYGFVAANADQDVTNSRNFTEGDIPPDGPLGLTTPQVYFGELLPDYSIVGAQGTAQREFDGNSGRDTYTGTGGIALSNLAVRTAFALKYKESNFLLNDAVSAKGARIILYRDPRQIVQKVAPFLKVDSDPYPAVIGGRIVWIVDAYTTINNFPYSEQQSLADLTADSLTASNRTAAQPDSDINYIRNSVKVTIDGFSGAVNLYAWDEKDPVLKAWRKVFPGLVQDGSAMPNDVRAHIRYPEDLFNIQRSLLEQYHVDNPVTFYNVGNKWSTPTDPYVSNGAAQPPYYVMMNSAAGTGNDAQFQLTSPMKVNNSNYLASYISVDSDPGPNYGRMTVLELPNKSSSIPGPEQVANNFSTNALISSNLSLLDQGGSGVVHGNLLTLPLGNSFLYVEPIYVQKSATTNAGFPTLQRVAVEFGDKIGYGDSLASALRNLNQPVVGQELGQTTGLSPGPTASSSPSTPTSTPASSSPPSSSAGGSLDSVLTQLDRAAQQLQDAYKTGDPVQIGQAEANIKKLSQEYLALRSGSAAPSKSAAPGASASSSAAPAGTPSATPAPSGTG